MTDRISWTLFLQVEVQGCIRYEHTKNKINQENNYTAMFVYSGGWVVELWYPQHSMVWLPGFVM